MTGEKVMDTQSRQGKKIIKKKYIYIRPFIRDNKVSCLTIHGVRNIVAGASLLITNAQFGKN